MHLVCVIIVTYPPTANTPFRRYPLLAPPFPTHTLLTGTKSSATVAHARIFVLLIYPILDFSSIPNPNTHIQTLLLSPVNANYSSE